MARPASAGPLGLRLALAFVGVALAAVAVLAGLTAAYVAADVSHLVARQQSDLTHAVAVAAGAAWNRSDSWAGANLSPVLDLAARVGADVQVRQAGRVVSVSHGFAGLTATHERREPGIGPCWTGSPSRLPSGSGRCATRCCGWPTWSMTCSGWPPPRRPLSS